jgi:hypothetical protein
LIIFGIVGLVILSKKGSSLDSESRSYADVSIMAIISHWDKQELLARASPDLLIKAPQEDTDRLFARLRTLGQLKVYNGSRGQARISINQVGGSVTANYETTADFDSGPAQITLGLIKSESGWRIQEFRVLSKVLL